MKNTVVCIVAFTLNSSNCSVFTSAYTLLLSTPSTLALHTLDLGSCASCRNIAILLRPSAKGDGEEKRNGRDEEEEEDKIDNPSPSDSLSDGGNSPTVRSTFTVCV